MHNISDRGQAEVPGTGTVICAGVNGLGRVARWSGMPGLSRHSGSVEKNKERKGWQRRRWHQEQQLAGIGLLPRDGALWRA